MLVLGSGSYFSAVASLYVNKITIFQQKLLVKLLGICIILYNNNIIISVPLCSLHMCVYVL